MSTSSPPTSSSPPSTSEGPEDGFRTASQVADFTQLGEGTIYKLARQGVIPSVRLGPRTVRFHLPSVLKALLK